MGFTSKRVGDMTIWEFFWSYLFVTIVFFLLLALIGWLLGMTVSKKNGGSSSSSYGKMGSNQYGSYNGSSGRALPAPATSAYMPATGF